MASRSLALIANQSGSQDYHSISGPAKAAFVASLSKCTDATFISKSDSHTEIRLSLGAKVGDTVTLIAMVCEIVGGLPRADPAVLANFPGLEEKVGQTYDEVKQICGEMAGAVERLYGPDE